MLSWRRPVPAAHGTDAEGACSVSSNLLHSTIIATASPSRRKVRLVYLSAYPRHPLTSLVLHLLMFRARNLRYARDCLLCALTEPVAQPRCSWRLCIPASTSSLCPPSTRKLLLRQDLKSLGQALESHGSYKYPNLYSCFPLLTKSYVFRQCQQSIPLKDFQGLPVCAHG